MAKRKSSPPSTVSEPQATYSAGLVVPRVALGVEDAVGGFLRPMIHRKHNLQGRTPSWATVAGMVRTYTERNELILGFLNVLQEEELRALFDTANQHLKDWEGVEAEVSDPGLRRSVQAHKESVRRIKVETRSLLERSMREMIAGSTAYRLRNAG